MKTPAANSLALLFALVLAFNPGFAAVEETANLKQLTGTWLGEGKLMGNPARLELKYEWVLNGKFLRLSLKNESKTASGAQQVFEGHVYYEPKSDGSVTGVWFDSRGISFPVNGTFAGDTLTVLWGSPEQEQGKSVYRLVDASTLEVIDSVQLKDGTFRQFAGAVVRRQ